MPLTAEITDLDSLEGHHWIVGSIESLGLFAPKSHPNAVLRAINERNITLRELDANISQDSVATERSGPPTVFPAFDVNSVRSET